MAIAAMVLDDSMWEELMDEADKIDAEEDEDDNRRA